MCTDHVNCTSTLSTTLHHVSPFFPDFLIIFTLLTILGNAHRPCLHSLSFHNNLTTKEYRVQEPALGFRRSLAHVILWWCCETSICTNKFTARAVKLFASVLNTVKTISERKYCNFVRSPPNYIK